MLLLALAAVVAHAADRVVLLLPAGESPERWSTAAALAGLTVVTAEAEPGVELLDDGRSFTVRVRDRDGNIRTASVPRPDTAAEREDVVWLAVSLLQSVPHPPELAGGAPIRRPSQPVSPPRGGDPGPPVAGALGAPSSKVAPRPGTSGRREEPRPTRAATRSVATPPELASAATQPEPAAPVPPPVGPVAAVPVAAGAVAGEPTAAEPAAAEPIAAQLVAAEPVAAEPVAAGPAAAAALAEPVAAAPIAAEPAAAEAIAAEPVAAEALAEPGSPGAPRGARDRPTATPLRGWARTGPAIAWREGASLAPGYEVAAGARVAGSVQLGVGFTWLPWHDLTRPDAASTRSFDLVATASWSPPPRPIAPLLGVSAGPSARAWRQRGIALTDFLVLRVGVEAGAVVRVSDRLAVVGAARAAVDVHRTLLFFADGSTDTWPSTQVEGAVSLSVQIP